MQHHLPVAEACRLKGYDVHVAAPDGAGVKTIVSNGFQFHHVNIARGKLNLLVELLTVVRLVQLYARLAPNLVHHLTHKPVLYGTLAARLSRVDAVVNANTGLGFLFIDDGLRTRFLRAIFQFVGGLILRHHNQVDLFLNEDDREEFVARRLTRATHSLVICGPGVDPDEYPYSVQPCATTPVVVLPARILAHKGVREFVDAARLLRERAVNVRCALVGDMDPGNRASIERAELKRWVDEGIVEHWGYQDDMQRVYAATSVCVLPSYREGLGRVLIEAASTGRALIAFDVPGCRDVVQDGFNGLLVAFGDVHGLSAAIERLATNHALCERFGIAGRSLVIDKFTTKAVVTKTLAVHSAMLRDTHSRSQQELPEVSARKRVEEVPA